MRGMVLIHDLQITVLVLLVWQDSTEVLESRRSDGPKKRRHCSKSIENVITVYEWSMFFGRHLGCLYGIRVSGFHMSQTVALILKTLQFGKHLRHDNTGMRYTSNHDVMTDLIARGTLTIFVDMSFWWASIDEPGGLHVILRSVNIWHAVLHSVLYILYYGWPAVDSRDNDDLNKFIIMASPCNCVVGSELPPHL
jgi:hypothetical protein